jgi:DNA-binding LacI/PurR family transcriptional regulator
MQTGKTMTIGVTYNNFANPYPGSILNGIQKTLHLNNYYSLVISWDLNVMADEHILYAFAERRIDGILMFPPAKTLSTAYLTELRSVQEPVIVIDQKWAGCEFDFVGSEDLSGAFTATEHLIKMGCKRIANIFTLYFSTGRERLEGFRKAMAHYNMPIFSQCLEDISDNLKNAYGAAKHLLSKEERPDGIVCFNDDVGIAVLAAAYDLGLRIPQDVSVIGFADLPIASEIHPQLTTIHQDSEGIGCRAAELLLERINENSWLGTEGFTPREIFLPTKLIVRQSTGKMS